MIRLETNDRFLRLFENSTILFLLGLTLVYYLVTGSWQDLVSVLLGGILALLNFRSIKREVRSIAKAVASGEQTARGATRTYLFKYYLRLVATAFVLFFVIKARIVQPLPLLLGISVVMVNILLCFLREVGRNFWLKFKEG